MIFFIVVCLFLLIAIPLVHGALKKTEQGGDVHDANTSSNDNEFYGASTFMHRDDENGSSTSHDSEAAVCGDFSPDSGFDSGSCETGSDSVD